MKIQATQFQRAFLKRAAEVLPKSEAASFASSPVDKADIRSETGSSDLLKQRFSQAVLAVATSAQLAGIPTLAAISQEVGQSLISPAQEDAHGESIAGQLSGLPRVESEAVETQWQAVAEATDSPFDAPEVIDSFFIYAQADSRGMYIGTNALEADLANESALAFTLAHEEAHRIHRDSAGAKGLETLISLVEDNDELYPFAFKALAEGRHQNENEADLFAMQTLTEMGRDLTPAYDFLNSIPEDPQHPAGTERAAYVRERLS